MGLQKRQNLPQGHNTGGAGGGYASKGSALTKAVASNKAKQATTADVGTQFLDARLAAASTGFSMEDLQLKGNGAAKKAPTNSGMKTVLAGESSINIERRIRSAAVPLGADAGDVAAVVEEMSVQDFDSSRLARRLMPKRPLWSYDVSSGRLHHREVQAFKQWLDDVRDLIKERGGYPPAFEQNLQVWRQLWRVLERCDVAVIVVDARHPLLHLPPALVYHVVRTLRKPAVVVLNKLDAVDSADAIRWAECLKKGIPGISDVVGFSKERVQSSDCASLAIGKAALIAACHAAFDQSEAIAQNDRSDTATNATEPAEARSKPLQLESDAARETDNHDAVDQTNGVVEGCTAIAGRIMLGLVGHPNVGKSSMVNSLMGGKVVSVKATPGHTKTLQTMILDDSTCLCDSPGVVFPRLEVPRETQIVGMLIPIAQVREPFSAIRWVMERAEPPLQTALGLKHVFMQRAFELRDAGTDAIRLDLIETADDEPLPWSPMLLCAQYATQRGFMNNGRPDVQKAGIEILERVLNGRIAYSVPPPSDFVPVSDDRRLELRHGDGSDSDGDWQIDDDDFESDDDEAQRNTSLFEHFGMEEKGPGGSSKASIKRHKRKEKLAALAGERD